MSYAKTTAMGLLIAALALGCAEEKKDKEKDKVAKDGGKKDGEKKGHTHGKGPNGGVVFDLGELHAEFDVKHDKKLCIVTILGEDEKTPKAVECDELTVKTKDTKDEKGNAVKSMTITLKPEGAKDGKASKFVGTDDGLAPKAEHQGKLFGKVNGKQVEGEFKEE